MRAALILPALALGFASAVVAAPPKLVASTPADAAMGVAPDAIRLSFDQAVLADGPHFTLQMMMGGQPMPVTITAVNHDGPNKLDLGLGSTLSAGRYELSWSVTNTTGETGSGIVHFGVR